MCLRCVSVRLNLIRTTMRIVNLKTFLAMPKGTVYAKYDEEDWFDELCIKDEMHTVDTWKYQDIVAAIPGDSSDEIMEKLGHAKDMGLELRMNFDDATSIGYASDGQLFAVFSKEDTLKLLDRLQLALKDSRA
jgi:hypothetical protein